MHRVYDSREGKEAERRSEKQSSKLNHHNHHHEENKTSHVSSFVVHGSMEMQINANERRRDCVGRYEYDFSTLEILKELLYPYCALLVFL